MAVIQPSAEAAAVVCRVPESGGSGFLDHELVAENEMIVQPLGYVLGHGSPERKATESEASK
jgi:hypothetical protein